MYKASGFYHLPGFSLTAPYPLTWGIYVSFRVSPQQLLAQAFPRWLVLSLFLCSVFIEHL